MSTDNPHYQELELVPVTFADAIRFVGLHHRHSKPPVTWRFGVGLVDGSSELVGVGIAGIPKSRMLMAQDPRLVEILRVCTLQSPNACSMLYGALCRAAKALGYRRAITYTMQTESGSSLRAAGFAVVAECESHNGWHVGESRTYGAQLDLFGIYQDGSPPKYRWERCLS